MIFGVLHMWLKRILINTRCLKLVDCFIKQQKTHLSCLWRFSYSSPQERLYRPWAWTLVPLERVALNCPGACCSPALPAPDKYKGKRLVSNYSIYKFKYSSHRILTIKSLCARPKWSCAKFILFTCGGALPDGAREVLVPTTRDASVHGVSSVFLVGSY